MARPKGSMNVKGAPDRAYSQLKQQSPLIAAQLVERALDGDTSAAKVILDRFIPSLKSESRKVNFELTGGTVTEQAQSVLKAVSIGAINYEVGSSLISSLANVLALKERELLEQRLADLEAKINAD